MVFNNKVYEVLKWLVQIVFPAVGAFYAAVASLWGFPYATEVVGTISAICVFLGACLRISTSNYSGDGVLTVDNNAGAEEDKYNLTLTQELPDLASKNSFVITVNDVTKIKEQISQ